jgi:hypothetical protein
MATTKSTVVGIRLDHERRAWIEAEAARLGVSVRGLFEGMIDEARFGESAEADRAIAGLGSAAPGARESEPAVETIAAVSSEESALSEQAQVVNAAQAQGVNAESSRPGDATSSPWSGVNSVTSVPGGLIREAFSLTASLIELSGRCATNRLSHCVLTRRFTSRTL